MCVEQRERTILERLLRVKARLAPRLYLGAQLHQILEASLHI